MTETEIAKAVGVSQAHINYLKNSKRGFSNKTAKKLAKVLGVKDWKDLLED